jgi:hypothetical protein
MGQATITTPWAKVTKKEWTDDIIQMVDVVEVASDDVEALEGDNDIDGDVREVCQQALKVERKKLSIILREYGRAYCDETGEGHKGSGKAQLGLVAEHEADIIGICEGDKRKPVTSALVGFAEAFGSRFAK